MLSRTLPCIGIAPSDLSAGESPEAANPPKRKSDLRTTPTVFLLVLMMLLLKCTSAPDMIVVGAYSSAEAAPLVESDAPADQQELLRQASENPVSLLEKGLAFYDSKIQDYEGTFILQERVGGRLRAQATNSFKFRTHPFSLAVHRLDGRGRMVKLLYVEGCNDNQMIVKPAGLLGNVVSEVKLDPHGETARKGNLNPVTEFGLRKSLVKLIEAYKTSAECGQLISECLGLGELDGKRVLTLQKTSSAGRAIVEIEIGTFLPLRIRRYTPEDELLAMYRYKDLSFNRGFDDSEFTTKANGF